MSTWSYTPIIHTNLDMMVFCLLPDSACPWLCTLQAVGAVDFHREVLRAAKLILLKVVEMSQILQLCIEVFIFKNSAI